MLYQKVLPFPLTHCRSGPLSLARSDGFHSCKNSFSFREFFPCAAAAHKFTPKRQLMLNNLGAYLEKQHFPQLPQVTMDHVHWIILWTYIDNRQSYEIEFFELYSRALFCGLWTDNRQSYKQPNLPRRDQSQFRGIVACSTFTPV